MKQLSLRLLLVLVAVFNFTNIQGISAQNDPPPGGDPRAPRIVGGVPAQPGAWPWQVLLLYNGSLLCGGSLIDINYVLTAAHCVRGFTTSQFAVVLGEHDRTLTEGTEQTRTVSQAIIHPSYNASTYDNDIALLRLNAPATLTSRVQLVQLLNTPQHDALFTPGTAAITTGWGTTTSGGSLSTVLRQVQVPIVSNATCNQPVSYDGAITVNMVCAGVAQGGVDSCQGDSGGPLVVPNGAGAWLLGGIVSWGYGCALPNMYGVYTRVANYQAWIAASIGSGTPSVGSQLWLRADMGVSESAGKVSLWADQSPSGNNAFMTTAARQPVRVTNALNGYPVIRFGGAQSLSLTTPVSPQSFTIFVVGKNSKPTETFSMILGPGGNWPNNQLRWENGTQVLVVGTSNSLPIIRSTIGNTRVYHALAVRYDGNSGRLRIYRDGSQVSEYTLTTRGPWTLAQIGAWYSTYFMQGDLAEVLVYDSALSEADRSATDSYLRTKYALP